LNDLTVKDCYPLPLIRDILDGLGLDNLYTALDVMWCFHNIALALASRLLAAFCTPFGLYKPNVMQFGMCNAPSVFQNLMNVALKEEVATRHVKVYEDDILIHTKSSNRDYHQELVRWVLTKLLNNN